MTGPRGPIFETDSLQESIDFNDKQITKQKKGERSTFLAQEDRAERSIHKHSATFTLQTTEKYRTGWDRIFSKKE